MRLPFILIIFFFRALKINRICGIYLTFIKANYMQKRTLIPKISCKKSVLRYYFLPVITTSAPKPRTSFATTSPILTSSGTLSLPIKFTTSNMRYLGTVVDVLQEATPPDLISTRVVTHLLGCVYSSFPYIAPLLQVLPETTTSPFISSIVRGQPIGHIMQIVFIFPTSRRRRP